jgi:hypothetical protein
MGRKRSKPVSRFVDEDDDSDSDVSIVESESDTDTDSVASTITDNALQVPLFADVDKRSTRSISKMRLYKMEPGGPQAYKGEIPLSSTYETIGHMFGDGIYAIEGLNHKHVVLATKDNIRISLGLKPSAEKHGSNGGSDVDRIERLARMSAEETTANNRAFTELIVNTTQAAAIREREFIQASVQQMTQFFTGMMQMQQQGYQQMMGLMQTAHSMTMQTMQAAENADGGTDKSMRMVETLLRGINVGRDLSDGEDSDTGNPADWQNILGNGLSLLAQTKRAIGDGAPNPQSDGGLGQLSPGQQRQLKEAVHVYQSLRARGIDPKSLLKKLDKGPEKPSRQQPDESEPDSDGDDSSDDFEDEESDDDSDAFESDDEIADSESA